MKPTPVQRHARRVYRFRRDLRRFDPCVKPIYLNYLYRQHRWAFTFMIHDSIGLTPEGEKVWKKAYL